MALSYLDCMFRLGNLVELRLGLWSGNVTLRPEDLGLEKAPTIAKKLGSKILIPSEALHRFENLQLSMKKTLRKNSYLFPYSRARFVPNALIHRVRETLDEKIARYMDQVEEFLDGYGKNKIRMRTHFVEAAEAAYTNANTDLTRDEYIDNYLDRIDSLYPPPEAVRKKFHAEYRVYRIHYPVFTYNHPLMPQTEEQLEKSAVYNRADKKKVDDNIDLFIENIVKKSRKNLVKKIKGVMDYIKKVKQVNVYTERLLNYAVDGFMRLDFYGDVRVREALNKMKAALTRIIRNRLIHDEEARVHLLIRLGDVVKVASHPKATEAAIELFRDKLKEVKYRKYTKKPKAEPSSKLVAPKYLEELKDEEPVEGA